MDQFLRGRIYNQNPWWQNPGEITSDARLTELDEHKIRFIPAVLEKFNLKQPAIYTLRGPRQVGKSTALKLLIQSLLLKKKVNPYHVFFYSADDLTNFKELYQLINEYQEILNESGTPADRQYIFIDEITSVPDWQKGIKMLYEEGKLKQAFLLLTGSAALDLRKGAERLPGRRGGDPYPDKILLPLSFREYLQHTGFPHFEQIAQLPPLDETLSSPAKSLGLKNTQKLSPLLRRWLNKYQLSGGFPRAANDLFSQNKIDQNTYEIYLSWLRGDVAKYGRSEHLARQILYELAALQTARVEWQTIARKIEIEAHTTVMDYAHLLEDIFALKIIYQVDFNKKKIQPKKRKKIFFLDPLVLWCVKGWNEKWGNFFSQTKREALRLAPALAEALVAQRLFRNDWENWQSPSVFFWHNSHEIDFLAYDNTSKLVPIEVKYQNKVSAFDAAPLKKLGFKKGLIISKNDFGVFDGMVFLPLEIFLALP